MKFSEPTKIHGKSGMWGTRLSPRTSHDKADVPQETWVFPSKQPAPEKPRSQNRDLGHPLV